MGLITLLSTDRDLDVFVLEITVPPTKMKVNLIFCSYDLRYPSGVFLVFNGTLSITECHSNDKSRESQFDRESDTN